MINRMDHRRSPPPQCCSVEDTAEFSLPEGVDLVGIDNNTLSNRKSMSSTVLQPSSTSSSSYHPQQYSSGTITRRKPGSTSSSNPSGWKTAVRLLIINIFVCSLVLGYALIGSFVFLALEGNTKTPGSLIQVSASGYPITKKANLTMAIWNSLQGEDFHQLKNEVVKNIWNITLSMNILYQDNWTRLTADEVNSFQRLLMEKILVVIDTSTPQETQYSWTFPRAFLFALTTLTTIGYGGIGPKTSSAKIATIVYAIFGIPIMLWYLSNVGSLLAKMVRFMCAKICCCCCEQDSASARRKKLSQQQAKGKMLPSSSTLSSRKVSDPYYQMKPLSDGVLNNSSNNTRTMSHHPNNPHYGGGEGDHDCDADSRPLPRASIFLIFVLCIGTLIGYVCLGSYIVSRWEHWRFLDSFYFCFLTLTTISFGDIRTQKLGGLERFQQRTEWFCSFYILFGMALTSMFFNILHEEISRRFKRWKTPPMAEPPYSHEDKEALATVNRARAHQRRPIENSYSVHYMNFSPTPTATTTASRNYNDDSLLQGELHSGNKSSVGVGYGDSNMIKSVYDEEEVTSDYIVSHPIPPPREIYGSHPVFPR